MLKYLYEYRHFMIDPVHPNFAFIDNQNLYMSVKSMGWEIDYAKLRIWLKQKFKVSKAYMFLGYIETNTALYTHMQEAGFILIFRPTLQYKDGTTKGNCDTELVLQVMHELKEFNQAFIVSGDGDFYSLYKYLIDRKKLGKIMIPNRKHFSALLRQFMGHIYFLDHPQIIDKIKRGI